MKTVLILTVTIALGACSHIADFADRGDPCQTAQHLNRPKDYQTPTWCGAAAGRTTILNTRGQPLGYIK